MAVGRGAAIAVLLLFLAILPAYAQIDPDIASPNIVINLPSRTLEFYSGSTLVKVYPVAIGKPSTPTPTGNFSIISKEVNPWWFPPRGGAAVPPGPDNPLGYRWMGFLPMYGIHGTNTPWAIGTAVSNGCVRMHEADVEELYEVVPYGTPVKVTYDRVKVRVDAHGNASVGIYPDIYGYSDVTLSEIKRKLAAYGLAGLVSDDFLLRLIREEPDRQVVIAQFHQIRVNGKTLVERAVYQENTLFVPVWAIAGALKRNIQWDEQTQTVRAGNFSAPGIVKGDILYITFDNVQVLFGGQQRWQQEERRLDINGHTAALNGKTFTSDVRVLDGILAIPLLALAETIGQKVVWDAAKKAATINGKSLPLGLIAGQPYIQITKIYDYFQAYVYWNESARSIELTYPFNVKGGND
ncbi:ErfK/YbiS/YcfS/YnhG family protein [Thermosinus carboxydivorans Nor1]|uniref:ErfK/YbiS/YcfS/YnhG family protein n=1 Tax=Thermosinus carboxydivorans Nor1 TaxID=401526 RepID=A1HPM2_9FIRM|nr:L,D-transpeptidase family protein [Thermosinus carboxydivorans]EAX47992.1 ErfK/YbiS/YcfS/YnhG family protein [Thermosinus carboxydivorans Nor1]